MKALYRLRMAAAAIGVLVLSLGCGESNSDNENAVVTLQVGSYSSAQFKWFDLLVPRAHAAVSSLNVCFKRLRFKPVDENSDDLDPTDDEDNIDFDLGQMDLSSAGTTLTSVVIPEGVYRRIEIDLENHCAGGNSIELTNDQGTFSSTERITIKFSGTFTASDTVVLQLGVQDLIDALNAYNGSGSLRDVAQGVSGSM